MVFLLKMKKNLIQNKKKKYKSLFDTYDKVKFKSDPKLSEKIDDVLYGDS